MHTEIELQQAQEAAEAITKATYTALDILEKAKDEAIATGLPVVAYMVALFIEYLEIREQAEAMFDKKEIESLIETFYLSFKTGELSNKRPEYDPAYK